MGKKWMKKEYAAKYADKPVEWLVNELAATMVKYGNLIDKLDDYKQMEKRRDRAIFEASTISIINENLKDVLAENGIRTRMLEIEYMDRDCKHCEYADYSNCMCAGEDPECGCEENWFGEECKYKTVISTMGFYTFRIDDKTITGITSDFEEHGYDVIRVKDMRSGETLYEEPLYEVEDDDEDCSTIE